MQQQQLQQLQQQQLQKQLLAQQLLMSGGGSSTGGLLTDKKQREVYVGNLAIGIVTPDVLKDFFNQVFAHMVPDPIATPPVVNINMDTTGRFGFVEFRTEDMAAQAMQMDKVVELCGRPMNIGRPKGYVEPPAGSAPPTSGLHQQLLTQQAAQQPTTVLLLTNPLPVAQLRNPDDCRVLQEEVQEEAARHGSVVAVCVPVPPDTVQDLQPGRCYIRYATPEDATKGKSIFDGRTLDDNKIKVGYVAEEEFARAQAGEWVLRGTGGVAGIPLPGLYTITPLPSGITGLAALNPALSALVSTNPGIAAMMTSSIAEDEVPFEEGYVKLRGFPKTVTKQEVVAFFSSCGEVDEGDIKMVLSADGTPLGEAFVNLKGPRAKVRLALAKDRSVMPAAGAAIEVFTSVLDDQQRRMLSGCMLV